jgi:hypothetical protein
MTKEHVVDRRDLQRSIYVAQPTQRCSGARASARVRHCVESSAQLRSGAEGYCCTQGPGDRDASPTRAACSDKPT